MLNRLDVALPPAGGSPSAGEGELICSIALARHPPLRCAHPPSGRVTKTDESCFTHVLDVRRHKGRNLDSTLDLRERR